MGALRLPKILVLTIDDSLSAQVLIRVGPSSALSPSTRRYPFAWRKGVLNGVPEYARLAMRFASVRASRYGIR